MELLEKSQQLLGPTDSVTMSRVVNLAVMYLYQEKWHDAKRHIEHARMQSETLLRGEHASTLNCLTSIALMYVSQGQWTKALNLHLQILQSRKHTLGDTHPDSLVSL